MYDKPFKPEDILAELDKQKKTEIINENPKASFLDELRAYGFGALPAVPALDNIQRIQAPDEKPHKRSGWYVYYEVPNEQQAGTFMGIGVFGSWKGNPERVVWYSKSRETMSLLEVKCTDEQMEAAKSKWQEEQTLRNSEAADKAKEMLNSSIPADENHPYIQRKKIRPHLIYQLNNVLLVPVNCPNTGKLTSVQIIQEDGGKRFLAGGRTKDCFYRIPGDVSKGIFVCEGYATAATIREATGGEIYVTFSANNLKAAFHYAHTRHQDSLVYIAGDDDRWTTGNPGKSKAETAAGSQVVFPIFADYTEGKPTDFNDLHVREGLDVVRMQINSAISKVPLAEKNIALQVSDPFPEHCLNIDGLFGDVLDWINKGALIPQPVLTFAATLTLFSTLFGRRYRVGQTNTHTNLFVIGLAVSGGGKDHARKCIKALLNLAGLDHLSAGGEFTSAGAIRTAVSRHPAQLAMLDEFGKYIAALTGRNASGFQATIIKTLLELYSDSGSVSRGTEYSKIAINKQDRQEREDIQYPSLNIYATSTPSTFFPPLQSNDVSSGFLNRFLVFEGDPNATLDPELLDKIPSFDPPIDIADHLKRAYDAIPRNPKVEDWEMSATKPVLYDIDIEPDALEVFKTVQAEQENRRLDKQEPYPDLWVRLFENTMKVAMVRAIADCPAFPSIKLHHVEWARDIVAWCVRNMSRQLAEQLADNERERVVKSIYQYISEAGATGRARHQVTRKFQRVNKRDRNEMLADLVEMGVVASTMKVSEKSKKPTEVYIAVGKM